MPLRDLINSAATANGLSPDLLARIVQIESGNNPNARTGSYHGLLQLGKSEFARYNPQGDIYDPAANLNAGAAKIAQEANQFRQQYGRDPTPTDIYLTHQQGQAGYGAHTANPEGVAWQNVRPYYSDEAARTKGFANGDAYAKAAIWGNVPNKAQFPGGVDTVTSQDFTNLWRNKVEGPGAGPPPSGPVQYGQDAPALGTPPIAPQPQGATSPSQTPSGAPAGGGGLLGQLRAALPAPIAGLLGIPAQAPQGIQPPPQGAQPAQPLTPYDPGTPPPIEMPPFPQLQFAQPQPMQVAPPQAQPPLLWQTRLPGLSGIAARRGSMESPYYPPVFGGGIRG